MNHGLYRSTVVGNSVEVTKHKRTNIQYSIYNMINFFVVLNSDCINNLLNQVQGHTSLISEATSFGPAVAITAQDTAR